MHITAPSTSEISFGASIKISSARSLERTTFQLISSHLRRRISIKTFSIRALIEMIVTRVICNIFPACQSEPNDTTKLSLQKKKRNGVKEQRFVERSLCLHRINKWLYSNPHEQTSARQRASTKKAACSLFFHSKKREGKLSLAECLYE
jgi:hypothetical protein